jgi:hypothetical protein
MMLHLLPMLRHRIQIIDPIHNSPPSLQSILLPNRVRLRKTIREWDYPPVLQTRGSACAMLCVTAGEEDRGISAVIR